MQVVSTIHAEKLRQIGVGRGMNSQVFLCLDPQLGGDIVIKEIPITSFPSPGDYFREAQQLYANKHPRIVPVLYACRDSTSIRIAMPYFAKGSLHDEIATRVLTTRELVRWGQEFLSGLHFVHVNGYIHFDVKPSNILIHDDGSAMLADFGQARITNSFGVSGIPAMYPAHITPEFCNSTGATKQSDIYQVGLTLYRMCNGNDFFDKQRPQDHQELLLKTRAGQFPNRQRFLPHVPSRLRQVIRRALNVDPRDRYQTAEDLMVALGTVDKLLDWQFFQQGDTWKWVTTNDTHEYHIHLQKIQNNWEVEGFSIRLDNGLKRRKTDWCLGSHSTQRKAERAVERLFRSME